MRGVASCLLAIVGCLAVSGCDNSGPIPSFHGDVSLEGVYATLHKAGFRVAIREPWRGTQSFGASTFSEPEVFAILPREGTPARAALKRGDVVTLVPMGGGNGSEVGTSPKRPVRAPRLIGKPASAAIAWAWKHGVIWTLTAIHDLPPSNAPRLYDAYRVVAQAPAAGALMVGKPGCYPGCWMKLQVEPR
jgi:hypothetical protein